MPNLLNVNKQKEEKQKQTNNQTNTKKELIREQYNFSLVFIINRHQHSLLIALNRQMITQRVHAVPVSLNTQVICFFHRIKVYMKT